MPEQSKPRSAANRDSIANTILVAVFVSLFCSVLVSAAAVLLKPQQQRNEDLYRKKIVLEVAGLFEQGADVDALFASIEPQIVDLASGDYVTHVDAATFDALAAAREKGRGIAVPEKTDIAGIRRRALYAQVFLVHEGDQIQQVILPVYGTGLWSSMRGYVSLRPDGRSMRGLRFFEHGETPGLGDQIDNPDWLEQWQGKSIYNNAGEPRIEVVKGNVQPGDNARFQVDGLSGATLTGRGVQNLLNYWLGAHGFGPYLNRLARESEPDG